MNIYQAITAIMGELGAISKDKKNVQQGFMYRGIDDVMNALNPLLAKHQVFVVPEVLEHIREERQSNKGNTLLYSICKIKYTFYASDGSSISAVVVGEGMDSGDKATNKAMAIAMKYAFFQTFCIATEEMKDPDEEVHELKTQNAGNTKKDKPPAKQDKPVLVTLEQAKTLQEAAIEKYGDSYAQLFTEFTGYKKFGAVPATEYEKVLRKIKGDGKC